jgi:hypothetical protein
MLSNSQNPAHTRGFVSRFTMYLKWFCIFAFTVNLGLVIYNMTHHHYYSLYFNIPATILCAISFLMISLVRR